MKKSRIAFVCSDCGSEYAKWQGQCHDCGVWNTLKQLNLGSAKVSHRRDGFVGVLEEARTLDQVDVSSSPRIPTLSDEVNRVLGGGLVPGSAILISGSPGAGKSTLLIQVL